MSGFVSIPTWVEKWRAAIKKEIEQCSIVPALTIVKVGNDPASGSYTKGNFTDGTIRLIKSGGGEVISGVGGAGLLTCFALLENVVKLHKMH